MMQSSAIGMLKSASFLSRSWDTAQEQASAKVLVDIPLSADVLARYKATGEGRDPRIDQAPREWIEQHPQG